MAITSEHALDRDARMRPWLAIRPHYVLLTIFLVAFPLVANGFWTVEVGARALILGVIALSLMFLAGYGGMVSLAQLTVAGCAGYMLAILGTNSDGLGLGWPWWLTIPASIMLATIFATLIGLISVRTEGIYTIMITLAIGVAFFYFTQQNYEIFNGYTGFAGIKPPKVFGINWRSSLPFYYLTLVVAAIAYTGVLYLSRATFGLSLQAIRDNQRRMSALGFHTNLHRVTAYAIAGAIAAIGGVELIWLNGRVSPGTVSVGPLIDILVIAVVGGLRRPAGPFIGAVIFILLQNFAIDLIDRERFSTVIGTAFLVIVLFSPDGVLGQWDRLKARFADIRIGKQDAGKKK